MKIYIAHNFEARSWLRKEIVPLFVAEGHEITSRWLDFPETVEGEKENTDDGTMDLDDIMSADCLVLFADIWVIPSPLDIAKHIIASEVKPGLGKFIEFGFALAKGKYTVVIAINRVSVFFNKSLTIKLETIQQALETIKLLPAR